MQQKREKRRNSGYPTSSDHSVTSSVGQDPREVLCRLGDRRKGLTKIIRRNLETIRFGCNRFGHWSGDPMCTARDRRKVDGQANITVKHESGTVFIEPVCCTGRADRMTRVAIKPVLDKTRMDEHAKSSQERGCSTGRSFAVNDSEFWL